MTLSLTAKLSERHAISLRKHACVLQRLNSITGFANTASVTRLILFKRPKAYDVATPAIIVAFALSTSLAIPVAAQNTTASDDGVLSATLPPAPPKLQIGSLPDEDFDRFMTIGNGYSTYINDRYGTFISYPSTFFQPESRPSNGDGRRFRSVDGAATFYVFAQHNALGYTQIEMIEHDKQTNPTSRVTYESVGDGSYVLSGIRGADIFYRKVISSGPNALVQVFEITYPAARKSDFDATLVYMADSFGPKGSSDADVARTQQVTKQTHDPILIPDALYTPQTGSAVRATLMDVARGPIGAEVDQPVIFLTAILNTDGQWAYLQAKPLQPNGHELNWRETPFAHEIQSGFMSDTAMVLMLRTGDVWRVIDYVLGPTDVYWTRWRDRYNLPDALFVK